MPRYETIFSMELDPFAPYRTFGPNGQSSVQATTANRNLVLNRARLTLYTEAEKDEAFQSSSRLLKKKKDGKFGLFQILTWEWEKDQIWQVDEARFYVGRTGFVFPPSNKTYAFVLMKDGSLRVGSNHNDMSQAKEVLFAGEVIFQGNGKVKRWNNKSGSYRIGDPKLIHGNIGPEVGKVPFRGGCFVAYNGTKELAAYDP